MHRFKNILLDGPAGKPILLDIFYREQQPQPLVIYAHGFNGFKDWGNFDLIADRFAEAGFAFVKFNFSHNGTTPEQPEEFADTEAFGHNNYTKELADLQAVIGWSLGADHPHRKAIDGQNIFLIGHSRGGGIVLLKGAEESRVTGIATWASVAQCKTPWGSWPAERINEWQQTGVEWYTNSRTKQQLPLYFQLYEDYQNNSDRLDIREAVNGLQVPLLICHGTKDETVPVQAAYTLHEAAKESELFLVESDHVFGRKHPWTEEQLPDPMQHVVERTVSFFQSHVTGNRWSELVP